MTTTISSHSHSQIIDDTISCVTTKDSTLQDTTSNDVIGSTLQDTTSDDVIDSTLQDTTSCITTKDSTLQGTTSDDVTDSTLQDTTSCATIEPVPDDLLQAESLSKLLHIDASHNVETEPQSLNLESINEMNEEDRRCCVISYLYNIISYHKKIYGFGLVLLLVRTDTSILLNMINEWICNNTIDIGQLSG